MANPAAGTADGPISVVAIEQTYPEGQRLIQDALAYHFLPIGIRAVVMLTRWSPLRDRLIKLSDGRAPGVWGGVLCRKRYIDDKLFEAVDAGCQAVVILGAGLDTRAYRLPAPGALPVFEVDLPENIARKRARLQSLYGGIPAHVTLVPMDFDSQDLASSLASQGYRAEWQTFFIWEAVTQYLSEAGIRNTLRYLAEAQAGSRLAFTYVRKDFIDGTNRYGLDALYETFRVKRSLWHFGLAPDQVSALLAQYAWKELEQVGSQEYTQRYLRPIGREMAVMDIERAVYAEKL